MSCVPYLFSLSFGNFCHGFQCSLAKAKGFLRCNYLKLNLFGLCLVSGLFTKTSC